MLRGFAPHLALMVVMAVASAGCSRWRPYSQPVDSRVEVQRHEPRVVDGQCVRTVQTTTTTMYDREYKFRTGIDLYTAAASLAIGWLFLGVHLAERNQDVTDERRVGTLTAGLVWVGFSLPFWTYFFWHRLDRPTRERRVLEKVLTSDELEAARGECPGQGG